MEILQKTLTFKLEKSTYTLTFPNVGQFMDIENMRMGLTNGAYTDLLRSGLKTSHFQVDLVDALSILMVLVPEIRKDLLVTNYNDLDIFLAKIVVKAYKKDVKPWFDGLMATLLEDDDIPEPLEAKAKEGEASESGNTLDLG